MTTIADDFGVWNNLGTVSPILNEWVKFPFQAIGGLNSIRLSFNYDLNLINDNNSYGLLRWTFNAGSNELIAKPQRVYVDKKTILARVVLSKIRSLLKTLLKTLIYI
jgi:hypothetical protein